ncbi:glycosyltransferase family 9 protein [bacterium]|nr:glycosyltransferase family 9 protein [bacterium]
MSFKVRALKLVDTWGGGIAARVLGLWNHARTLGPPFVEIVPGSVRRVVFIRPGGMGDLLLLLPAAKRLKDALPGVHIAVVAEKRNRAVAKMSPVFDEVLCYDEEPLRFLRKLRAARFDIAIDTEQFHYSSAIFAYLSGAPVRIGFKINPARNELYTHLVDYPMDRHETEAFDLLVRPVAGERASPIEMTGLLDTSRLPDDVPGLPDARDFVAVFPFGVARGKSWPAGRWAEIVRRLLARGEDVVLIGGADSVAFSGEVLKAVNDTRVRSVVGQHTLAQTGTTLSRAKLLVACDTGVTHLAHALGTPAVVLFGASDERKWGPPESTGTSVTSHVPCRPCSIYGYVKLCRTIDCMDRISQELVWNAIEARLAGAMPSRVETMPEPQRAVAP